MIDLRLGDNVTELRTMPDECIDLTVTSPPYDNLRTYGGHTWDFENLARELYRVTKRGGVVVWVVGDATIKGSETGTSFRQALFFMECGFNLHDTMIYKRKTAPLTHNRYEQEFEYMFVLSKGAPRTVNHIKIPTTHYGKKGAYIGKHRQSHTFIDDGVRREKIIGNVWEYAVGGWTIDHPAVFPEALARDHILSWSNEGDTVLDPFAGSGTTLKMALMLNRNAIGIEIHAPYVEIIKQRLAVIQPQLG